MLLSLFTVVGDKFDKDKFFDALVDETFIRCVMWWQRKQIQQVNIQVFNATITSQEILISQVMLINDIIGKDLNLTAEAMDKSYGKLHDKLECFQQK